MAYLVAAYLITGIAVGGYAFWLRRRRNELRADSPPSDTGPTQPPQGLGSAPER